MGGASFVQGEIKVRPGIYFRTRNVQRQTDILLPRGICAALFQADWGPLGQVVTLENELSVSNTYLDGQTTIVLKEMFRGGALSVKACRLGTGGTKPTYTLKDTTSGTALDAVRADGKYAGAVTDISITIRDSLTDEDKRECLIYKGAVLKKTYTFTKGSTGDGEPKSIVDTAAADPNSWVDFTKLADGNKILAAITQQALSGGANPTIDGTAYANAFLAI